MSMSMRIVQKALGDLSAACGMAYDSQLMPDCLISFGAHICIWDSNNLELLSTLTPASKAAVYFVSIVSNRFVVAVSQCYELWDVEQKCCLAVFLKGVCVSKVNDHTIQVTDYATYKTCSYFVDIHAMYAWIQGVARGFSSSVDAAVTCLTPITVDAVQGMCSYVSPLGRDISCKVDFITSREWPSSMYVPLQESEKPKIIRLILEGMSSTRDYWGLQSTRAVGCCNGDIVVVSSFDDCHGMTLAGHSAAVNAIASLDNNRFLSASDDHSIRLWSLDTMSCLATFLEHGGPVKALCKLSGGRVVSLGTDGMFIVWDTADAVLL